MAKVFSLFFLSAVFFCSHYVNAFDLTLMHTNSIRAHFEEFNKNGLTCYYDESEDKECYGGVARRTTRVNEIRVEHPNPILLDTGDHLQGTQWYSYYNGNATAHFMNGIQYDAMAPSNHEFDYGVDGLLGFLKQADFSVISANMDVSQVAEMEGLVSKSLVLEFGEERVGIVGYTTTETAVISNPGDVTFTEEIPAIQDEVDRLTSLGINKIIVLGNPANLNLIDLAGRLNDVDIIVGDAANYFLYNGEPPTDHEVTGPYPLVHQRGDSIVLTVDTLHLYGMYLGLLQVTFDENGKIENYQGNPICLDSSIDEDPAKLTEVNEWVVPIRALGERVVGQTYAFLDGDYTSCRVRECNLGNFLADALLSEHVEFQGENGWSDVSIAIINSGGIRASIPPGEIKGNYISTVIPFEKSVDVVDLRGHHLLQVLEKSVEEYPMDDSSYPVGYFLQYSGLYVTYDLSKPPLQRVVDVRVRCANCPIPVYRALDTEAIYRVVMQSFLSEGGDGYTMIPENMNRKVVGRLDSVVVNDYLEKHSPIAPGLQGRIVFVTSAAYSLVPSLLLIAVVLLQNVTT